MSQSTSKATSQRKSIVDPWEKLTPTIKHSLCLIILIFLPTMMFPQVFWGDQRFIGHDTIQWRASSESIIAERASTGEEPLWASNQFSGMPAYLVSYQKMVPNFDNLMTIPETLYPASYFWVLMIGMYLLLISLGFRPLSAVLGAILAGFSTYLPIIIGAGHNSKFVALSYIPWVLLGYSMLTKSQKNPLMATFVLAAAFVLHLRAGHPQITYYFLWVLGIWFITDLYTSWKKGEIKSFAKIAGLVLAAATITLIANAQPYWSIYEYSPFSIRGGGGVDSPGGAGLDMEYAFRWSQGWGELLTLLIPNAYGGSEMYWGPKSGTSGPHYFGAFTMLFIIIGLWKSTFKQKWVFFGAGFLTLLFSLGNNFEVLNNFMFSYFPLFDKFRAPETWLVVAGICFPIVAVAGIEYILEKSQELKYTDWLPGMAPFMVIAVIFAIGSGVILSYDKPGQFDQFREQMGQANNVSPSDPRVTDQVNNFINTTLKPERKAMASADSLRLLLFVVVGTAVVVGVTFRKLSPGPATLILILVAGYDMITVGNRYANESSLAPKEFDAARAVEQTRRPIDTWLETNVKTNETWSYRVFPLSENAFNNAVPAYFYPSIGGYSGARMALYDDLMSRIFFTGDYGLNVGVLSMLNTKYLTFSPGLSLPGWEVAYEDASGVVYENTRVMPKAWMVADVDRMMNRDMAIAKLNDFSFNPEKYALVETDTILPELTNDSTATITVNNYSARLIDLSVSRSSGNGLLVLSEMYYPVGWTATINGEPAEIIKTNYVLRGILVPQGDHQVTLRFEPSSHRTGTTLAYTGHALLLLLLGAALLPRFRTKKTDDEPTS